MQEMIRLVQHEPKIAETMLAQTLEHHPNDLLTLRFLALAKRNLRLFDEAVELFQRAVALDSQDSETYNQLALCLRELGRHDEAIECMSKTRNWLNLGKLYLENNQIEDAVACLERAISTDPDSASAHYDLSLAYGLAGNWTRCFVEYEWRFKYYNDLAACQGRYPCLVWNGKTSLAGKRIIVYCEQGYGDWIQFIRYVPELQQRGASVVLHCPPALMSLFRCNGYEVVDVRQLPPAADYHCSVMSLPHLVSNPSPRQQT